MSRGANKEFRADHQQLAARIGVLEQPPQGVASSWISTRADELDRCRPGIIIRDWDEDQAAKILLIKIK